MLEMRKLKFYDVGGKIHFVDIQHPDFETDYPKLDWQALNARIHGMLENGQMVTGLDATYHAWDQVGKGWVYAPLRWPVIKWFADLIYLFFAKYRYRISYLLTGQKRCTQCIPMSINQQPTATDVKQGNSNDI